MTEEAKPKAGAAPKEAARAGKAPEAARPRGRGLAFLALLLGLAALGLAGWNWQELERQRAAGEDYAAQSLRLLADLQQEAQAAEQRLQGTAAEWKTRVQALSDAQAGNEAARAALRQEFLAELAATAAAISASNQRWLLAEALHLTDLANQRALLARDPAAALQLLESADQTLARFEGLAAHPLREALARDMAALKAVPPLDIPGIYLGLSAVISQIPELKQAIPQLPNRKPPSLHNSPPEGECAKCKHLAGGGSTTALGAASHAAGPASALGPPTSDPAGASALGSLTPPQGGSDSAAMQRARDVSADGSYGASAQRAGGADDGYWAYLARATEALGGRLARLVDFRHGRLEVKPILPASEDYYLRQNLILKLQLAQLGLVSGDQPVYQRSLTLAMTWLSDGFDTESPLAQSLLATLGDYAAMRIDQPLPDISASLQLARQALRQAERAAGRGAQAQAGRGAATQAGRRAQARGLAERAAEGQQTQ